MGGGILTHLKNLSQPPPKEIQTNLKMIGLHELPSETIYEMPSNKTVNKQREFIKENKILIFDTFTNKSYIPALENFEIKDKSLTPTILYLQRGAGGGSPDQFLGLFFNPASNLYYPKILIDFSVNLLATGVYTLILNLYKRFKKTGIKRQQIVYRTEKTTEYYEFRSDASEKDFIDGLIDIPKHAKKNKKSAYYFRDSIKKKWIEEDVN